MVKGTVAYLTLLLIPGPLIGSCQEQEKEKEQEAVKAKKELLTPELVLVPETEHEIALAPVTNQQYVEFLKATDRDWPSIKDFLKDERWIQAKEDMDYPWRELLGKDKQVPEGKTLCPVALVTREEALAYCRWLSGVLQREFVLPPKDVYEKAMQDTPRSREAFALELEKWREKRKESRKGKDQTFGKSPYVFFNPLAEVKEFHYRSNIGCSAQDTSFGELASDGLACGSSAWSAEDKKDQRYEFHMQGPCERLVVIGFRVAAKVKK